MSVLETIAPFAHVPMMVNVELDCGTMTLADLLRLGPGSTISTRRPAGDSFDLRVGGALAGQGEVIANGRTIGVRIMRWGDDK